MSLYFQVQVLKKHILRNKVYVCRYLWKSKYFKKYIINFYIRRIVDTTYISRYNRVQHKFIGNIFPLLAQIELAINWKMHINIKRIKYFYSLSFVLFDLYSLLFSICNIYLYIGTLYSYMNCERYIRQKIGFLTKFLWCNFFDLSKGNVQQ